MVQAVNTASVIRNRALIHHSRVPNVVRLFEPRPRVIDPEAATIARVRVQTARRGPAPRTLRRYGSGLGFFDDFDAWGGGWEDFGGDELLDIPADEVFFDSGVLDIGPDFGGDDILDLGPLMPDESGFDFVGVPADEPVFDSPQIEDPYTMRVPEDDEALEERFPRGAPSAPSPAQVATSTAGSVISSIFGAAAGAATAAATRRVSTGAQSPGTIYLPGSRPGTYNMPGQYASTMPRYASTAAPSATSRAVKQATDFIRANPVPVAIGVGLLAFALFSGRKSK